MTEALEGANGPSAGGMTTSGTTAQGSQAEKQNAPQKSPQEQQQDRAPRASSSEHATEAPKKRRKVNHACVYCRRSHMTCDLDRPCARCIKRSIGHLCHDEPRESVKRSKTDPESATGEADASKREALPSDPALSTIDRRMSAQDAGLNLAPPPLPRNRGASAAPIAQPTPVSAPQLPSLASANQALLNYNDWTSSSYNNFQDMHHFHPSHMFNTSEVSNEYNLLNDFLSSSLMDDNTFYGTGDFQQFLADPSLTHAMGTLTNEALFNPPGPSNAGLLPPPATVPTGPSIPRPASGFAMDKVDKAKERYYMTAADPAGTDSPEERMNKLLKAKMDAGLLKPFNYVKGYARLNQYMEHHLQLVSRQRIRRQLERFRPRFRERMQSLTDMELVRVEMWFDKALMEYDRVFASMAMPACCWRRTGEIYRGNMEMAELIHVSMGDLRDGKIALHEIIAENSLVSYWEKFGQIAFDPTQKAILTSCSLKNPDPNSKDPEIRCCFSFTVKRDMYNIPAMIVGNFLPIIDQAP